MDSKTRTRAGRRQRAVARRRTHSHTHTPTPTEPRVGDRLGSYRLSLELARGGMATVFLARAPARAGLHRFVAVKCIRDELARNPHFIELFFDEARIAAQIQHANVCSVLDFDVSHGTYFLVMEFLSGRTMADIRRELANRSGEWDPRVQTGIVARMLADACEGLHSVHEARNYCGDPLNVVHRDVSPGNLFVTYDGNVKVIDFGVACGSGQRHKTRTGVVKGKYAYLAPEILHGEKPDRRADIWGLGVVAWELLTHRRLFDQGSDIETLTAISKQVEPPRPSSIRKEIPKALDEIVMSALQPDPRKRCASARTLGKLFNRYLVEESLTVGLAEVAEAMTALFPEGPTLTRKLLQVADQIDEKTVEIESLHDVLISAEVDDDEGDDESLEIDEGTAFARRNKRRARPARSVLASAARMLKRRLGAGLAGAAVAAVILLLTPCTQLTPASQRSPAAEAPDIAEPLQSRPVIVDGNRMSVIEDYDERTGEIILRLRPTPESSVSKTSP